ncbi:MAG: GYD domain-containing protein [Pirellulales bacterium]|nr:GYD domain-containing protein [Pirellulales bacterium]
MATYLTTVRFTPTGLAAIQDTTKRAATFKTAAKKLGVKVAATYWTLGDYDGLLVLEAADDQAVTKALIELAALGNVRTATVPAFTAGEIDKLLSK